MYEIDPQSGDPEFQDRLAKALRHLAASSPQSASSETGTSLLGEFRRHHARRRRIRRTAIGVLVACLALIASLVSLRNQPHSKPQTARQTQSSPAVPPTLEAMTPAPRIPARRPSSMKHASAENASTKNASTKKRSGAVLSAANREFVALPGYDPAVPADELRVVRVQVPASTLWQIGAPVSVNAGTHSVTADVVVSQSGTPYAVRLVQ